MGAPLEVIGRAAEKLRLRKPTNVGMKQSLLGKSLICTSNTSVISGFLILILSRLWAPIAICGDKNAH